MPGPGQTTLGEIVAQAKNRADMSGSSFISDSEWTSLANASLYELRDLMVASYGEDHFLSSTNFYLTSSVQNYALPSDLYKSRGVDLQVSSNSWRELSRFNFGERNKTSTNVYDLKYRLAGSNIMFDPVPQTSVQCRLWYVPRMTALSSSLQTVDGVAGWEDYVVVDMAIKALQKEESDVSALMVQKQELKRRIETMAEDRDAGMPQTVTVTGDPLGYGRSDDWEF